MCSATQQLCNDDVMFVFVCVFDRALHYAAQHGLVSVVQLLLSKGANTMTPDENGQ